MGQQLTRKRLILAKIESVYGTDSVPTGASNAILISGNLNPTPIETNLASRELIRPFFGNFAQLPAAVYSKMAFDVELAGSGTAGVAPAWGPLMRACGFGEKTLAAAAAGTATGGSATSIVLAAGASAVDQTYFGMRIRITGGTGSGQSATIINYVGSSKTATLAETLATPLAAGSIYSIDPQVSYAPISSSLESVSMYFNQDGLQQNMLGCRGSVSIKFPLWGIPKLSFEFQGLYATPTDTPAPATVTLSAFQQPVTVNNTNTTNLNIYNYLQAQLADLNINMANELVFRSLVGGTQSNIITDRKPAGDFTVESTAISAYNWWTAAVNATSGPMSLVHGQTAGNSIFLSMPKMQMTKPGYDDKDGVAMMKAGLVALPNGGNDELFISAM